MTLQICCAFFTRKTTKPYKSCVNSFEIARDYFLVINVSHFSLVAIANAAMNVAIECENSKLYFSREVCKIDKIDAITSN